MRLRVLALVALLPLGACSTVEEAVHGPNLTPMGYPSQLVPRDQVVLASARETPTPASANSLWRAGARAFFIDQRAGKVGDILTVQIDIDDSAKTSNSTSSSRTSGMKSGVPHFLGLETSLGKILPGAFDPANAIETNATSSNAGDGSVNRAEKISLTIAAVVTSVLPNGNMVIQGTQEVRTNTEMRQLTVSGVVRPEDITSANTIKHTQIAEARISYGGRGDISRVQKTPWGQSVVEKVQPF
ncbi:MAG: flagellar basal body L-ring protein FlgH [Phenylobacterium sp.]